MYIIAPHQEPIYFPPLSTAEDDGLLAIGGDLSQERLLLAYRSGIFPWYSEEDPILWWSPDPRFVLFPDDLKVSKSMQQVLKKNIFEFRINTAFEQVMQYCRQQQRPDQDGTWITNEICEAYHQLHLTGYAHSAECFENDVLVGGLYGVWIGQVFLVRVCFFIKPMLANMLFTIG